MALQQLRDDAITMLVLWATTQPYSADIESLLRQWAGTLNIAEAALQDRLNAATMQSLLRPPDQRTGLALRLQPLPPPQGAAGTPPPPPYRQAPPPMLQHQQYAPPPMQQQPYHHQQQQQQQPYGGTPPQAGTPSPLGADSGAFVPGSKRGGYGGGGPGGGAGGAGGPPPKRYKTVDVVVPGDLPFANLGAEVGRKVLRYWPKDAGRNRDNPWFAAVVTDYDAPPDPATSYGRHTLTYNFGTAREEKEVVSLSALTADELRLTDDWVDLVAWFGDAKKRRRSSAVEKSAWVKREYLRLHGGNLPQGVGGGGGGGSKSRGGGGGGRGRGGGGGGGGGGAAGGSGYGGGGGGGGGAYSYGGGAAGSDSFALGSDFSF